MTLKEVSQLTGIPYDTLRGWSIKKAIIVEVWRGF